MGRKLKVTRAPAVGSNVRESTAEPTVNYRLKVLIVEDHEDDALLMVRHLKKSGCKIQFQRVDTVDGLRVALASRTWDVVLCDHGLAGFNPLDVHKIVKEHGLDLPFIVVSGSIGEEKAAEVMRGGIHDLILKNNLSRLTPAIDRELKEARARRAKAEADEALAMERRLLHNLMANIPDAIYFKDRHHRYTRLNEAEAGILNADSTEAVIGKRADDFLDKTRAKMRWEEEERIIATGEPLVGRVEKAEQSDGTVRWYSAAKAPIRDDRGDIIGLVGITRDVTRMKQAEQALRDSEAFLRGIVDYSPAALVIKDVDGRNLLANRTFCSWYATTAINIVGKTHNLFLSKEASARVKAQEKKVLETKAPVQEERRVSYPDGVTRDVLVQKFPILDDRGDIRAIGTLITNISRRKRTEVALKESEQRFRDIATAASDWFWEMDENLRFTYLSDQYRRVTGQDPAAVIGKTRPQNAGADPDDENWKRHLADLAARRPFQDFTYPIKFEGGSVRYIRAGGVPFFDEAGNFSGYRGTATDVTEHMEAQKILRQMEKMESLGSLAGGIAHDFNNMLLPILALTKMTLKKLPDDSEHREKLEKVLQAATRAKDLVAKILAFSRQEDAQRQNVDVVEILNETLGLLRTTLPSTIKLEENLGLDSGQIFADAAQIGTVLLNLASNAADAMDDRPGSLEVSLTRTEVGEKSNGAPESMKSGAYVRIRIKDTGCGMDETTVKRIFEPFFTTKEVGKGTGLGLATAYGIINKHGGVIDVSSEIDVGTTFDVYLPLAEEHAAP